MDESSSDDKPTVNKQFKVTVLGDGAVGKSSICNRYCKDFFAQEYKQTLGLDFFTQTMNLPNDIQVTFNLFDIGGQSLESKMLKTYTAGSQCALYVFDLTNRDSLLNLIEWQKKANLDNKNVLSVLIGNKSDLATKRTCKGDEIEQISKQLNAKTTMNISALTGDRVQMMFVQIAGFLTGQDLQRLMLEERKVVAAVIKQEDQTSGAKMNEKGDLLINKDKFTFQAIRGEDYQEKILKEENSNKVEVTANIVQKVEIQPNQIKDKKKSRGLCGGM